MDTKSVLLKLLVLIYRTRNLKIYSYDDFILNMISEVEKMKGTLNLNGVFDSSKELIKLCRTYLDDKEPINKDILISECRSILINDDKIMESFENMLSDMDESSSKKIISSLVKNLSNIYREFKATEIIVKASNDIRFRRSKIGNFSHYLKSIISELEPLSETITSIKDPAIVNEIDLNQDDDDNITSIFQEVKNLNSSKSIYKTGWQALNRMLQGGFRRGEFVSVAALQHKYKSSFTLSLFMQIARHNNPIILKEEQGKKPLLLRISFEDSLANNLQFMYQYLKAHEGIYIKQKDFEVISEKEMRDYIVEKLTIKGFHIKLMRVNPDQWTYSSLFNKIIELETQGYSVHLLMLDYITLIPTTGCQTGPYGTDKRDLIRKVRNFCSNRNILLITPLQLSSEAKMLIRSGYPEEDFLNEISEKGYYDGAKSLDQDIDLELFIHLFTHNNRKYLAVRRGKHRLPTIIDEKDKFFILPFTMNNVPITEDIDSMDKSLTRIPKNIPSNSSLEGIS
ncbi:MAG: hypothetical protein QXF12_02845 [Candidatus Aenigmatarchaeota archaeon]